MYKNGEQIVNRMNNRRQLWKLSQEIVRTVRIIRVRRNCHPLEQAIINAISNIHFGLSSIRQIFSLNEFQWWFIKILCAIANVGER